MTAPVEEWRPVVGWEKYYEVSNTGRVRSLVRLHPNKLTGGFTRLGGNLLSVQNAKRYVRATLYPGRVSVMVHRLVAEAFLGPAPEGKPDVLHWDDDKTNNHVSNLRWGNDRENALDKTRNGRNQNALKTHCKNGHEFSEENTFYHDKGSTVSRVCRTCSRERDRKRDGTPIPPGDPRHGTIVGYGRHRCKCEPCVTVGRAHTNKTQPIRRAKRKAEK